MGKHTMHDATSVIDPRVQHILDTVEDPAIVIPGITYDLKMINGPSYPLTGTDTDVHFGRARHCHLADLEVHGAMRHRRRCTRSNPSRFEAFAGTEHALRTRKGFKSRGG